MRTSSRVAVRSTARGVGVTRPGGGTPSGVVRALPADVCAGTRTAVRTALDVLEGAGPATRPLYRWAFAGSGVPKAPRVARRRRGPAVIFRMRLVVQPFRESPAGPV